MTQRISPSLTSHTTASIGKGGWTQSETEAPPSPRVMVRRPGFTSAGRAPPPLLPPKSDSSTSLPAALRRYRPLEPLLRLLLLLRAESIFRFVLARRPLRTLGCCCNLLRVALETFLRETANVRCSYKIGNPPIRVRTEYSYPPTRYSRGRRRGE